MRTFTPIEIDLCKKIAKKYRRKIFKGHLFALECDKSPFLIDNYEYWREGDKIFEYQAARVSNTYKKDEWFPLWQEHDCLEWLREKGWDFGKINWNPDDIYYVWIHHYNNVSHERDGKTLLEALLRAVLAVMEK